MKIKKKLYIDLCIWNKLIVKKKLNTTDDKKVGKERTGKTMRKNIKMVDLNSKYQ